MRGNPLPYPLYHGTFVEGLDCLQPSERGLFGAGIYMSSDPVDALLYGDRLAIVRASLARPMIVKADYSVAEGYDLDSPAGQLILDVMGLLEGESLMQRLRHAPDANLDSGFSDLVKDMGHDGLLIDWPDGIRHVLAFDATQVEIEQWLETDAPASS